MYARRMKLVLAFVALSFCVHSAGAEEITLDALRQFQTGKTTYDQVVEKFGEPAIIKYSDEGLKVIVYSEKNTKLNDASVASVIGSMASIFIPGAAGLATSAVSLATGTLAGGATGAANMTVFLFDKRGVLIRYRMKTSRVSTGGFNSQVKHNEFTSRDGATPVTLFTFTDDSQKQKGPFVKGDIPRLGVQYTTIDTLQEIAREKFRGAKIEAVLISNVIEGSPAAAALKEGDYLTVFNGVLLQNGDDVAQAMSTIRFGDTVKARIWRGNLNANIFQEKIVSISF